jgi:uncharacterized protein with HEPN domain
MREEIRDKGRLQHILDAIDKALKFTENVSFDEYITNTLLKYAVIKCVEIVGEASYKLTNKFREQHSNIEWNKIIAMRHILVHGYYQTEDKFVWDTVKNYLPPLKEQVQILHDNS